MTTSDKLIQGPWGTTRIVQTSPVDRLHRRTTGRWWTRDSQDRLWVRCGNGHVHAAPIPPASTTRPIPNRAPSPRAITVALDMRGMHGPEVDEALGVATAHDTTVDSWEAGDTAPTVHELRRLATLTGFPVDWFFRTPPDVDQIHICGRGAP